MTGLVATSLARRDLASLLGSLSGLVLLCWWYLFDMASGMADTAIAVGLQPWSISDFGMMFVMWVVMMVGMMVPTAVRSVMIFMQIAANAETRGRTFVSSYWFAAGYALIWTVFSVFATLLQWVLGEAALLSEMMIASSSLLGAAFLLSAGAWQFSSPKDACLNHCRSPAAYIATHYRPGINGAIRLGVRHGLYCLGCCWMLMTLLFVGGVMNLVWILAITSFVLAEKLLPTTLQISRIGGLCMMLAGTWYLAAGLVKGAELPL